MSTADPSLSGSVHGAPGVGTALATTPAAIPGARIDATAEGTVRPREIGGREGPEPTRFGDWEKSGRCIDF